ncbi:aldehyde dehydrogenase family protein [Actinacidiphila glaucinigra]|uniref:aldehyde dehydrogenase family protein n=1 Tax=Actinacidiphila glaucinigra TaxID=235986 RepID=UPI00369BDADE
MIVYDRLYIGGVWTAPAHPGPLDIHSPHDRSLLGRAAQAAPGDADVAVATARAAFNSGPWPHMDPEERQEVIRRVNGLREERAAEAAARVSAATGTPRRFADAEQASLTRRVDACLKAAEEQGWEETVRSRDPSPAFDTIVRREAVGVVAAVITLQCPFSAATARLTPALLAGNTVILKATPENSLSMGLLAELYAEAGLPEGALSVLPADRDTGEYLVAHPDVDAIAFTGSTRAGRRVAALAGEQLKRVRLELGGKSAAILLDDADLARTVRGLFASLGDNGRMCAARTRVLAPRRRYEEVVAAVAEAVGSLKVGDPADPDTSIGPMAGGERRERLMSYIDLGIEEGARLVTGGSRVPAGLEQGYYVTPTVLADVDHRMRIAQDEISGPVLTVIAHDGDDDAVRLANDSEYRMSGGVWSADPEHAVAVARRLRTGAVAVNGTATGLEGTAGLDGYVVHRTITRPR